MLNGEDPCDPGYGKIDNLNQLVGGQKVSDCDGQYQIGEKPDQQDDHSNKFFLAWRHGGVSLCSGESCEALRGVCACTRSAPATQGLFGKWLFARMYILTLAIASG